MEISTSTSSNKSNAPTTSEQSQVIYGQIVLGPPGSGKTTYCFRMAEYLRSKFGKENVMIVNLDPGNDSLPYECDIDAYDLISVEDVMDRLNLGPNGALIYCMKFLDENFEIKVVHSIKRSFSSVQNKGPFWVIFDMPGQVELNTHVDSVKNIVLQLENTGFRLCSLHLVDSHYCSDPGKYIACLLTSLTTMLHINLPHINILSKIDLVEKYGKLPFNLDYYTDVLDLNYLVDILDNDKGTNKYKALNNSIAELVDSYSLVSFQMLDVQNDVLVEKLAKLIDRILGRVI